MGSKDSKSTDDRETESANDDDGDGPEERFDRPESKKPTAEDALEALANEQAAMADEY